MLKTLSTLALALTGYLIGADLDAATRTQTIEELEKSMNARYVFPDNAKKAAEAIRSNLKAGKYDEVKSGSEFAKLLTTHLNEVCKDAHLRVRYSEQPLPVRENRAEPSAEEIAAAKKRSLVANVGFEKVERLIGNIGYLKFNYFDSGAAMERPCKAAFEFLSNTDALIIDVRENGGGSPDGVRHICSYLFGEEPVHLNDLYFREGDRTESFWTLKDLPGPRYQNRDVYVLVSKRTGSGAEEFAYNLKNLKRATIIGENTWGGANPGGEYRLNDHFAVFIPTGRAINPISKTNWEGTGVEPDVRMDPAKSLLSAHIMAVEKLLSVAKDEDDKKRWTATLESLKAKQNPG